MESHSSFTIGNKYTLHPALTNGNGEREARYRGNYDRSRDVSFHEFIFRAGDLVYRLLTRDIKVEQREELVIPLKDSPILELNTYNPKEQPTDFKDIDSELKEVEL